MAIGLRSSHDHFPVLDLRYFVKLLLRVEVLFECEVSVQATGRPDLGRIDDSLRQILSKDAFLRV